MPLPDRKPAKESLTSKIVTQLVAVLFFVGVPVMITAIAPVSWIKFQREGDHIIAQAKTCLLFIIPFKVQTVDPVTSFSRRTIAGSITIERKKGTDERHTSDSEGILIIQGPQQTVEVSVTPANLDDVLQKSNAFLKDAQGTELKIFAPANWKFSVIFGGLASCLTVLYAMGVSLGILKFAGQSMGIIRKA